MENEMSRIIIVCPVCEGIDIKHVRIDLNKEHTTRISMDDDPPKSGGVPAVIVHRNWLLICQGCGYTKEYSQAGGW